MPNWTEEQQLAIDKENTNIIVSAGAGSGKTMVLTARVLRKLESGTNINRLLILTFTNKAANEMKDRIRKAITKNKSVNDQLDYIDSSYITTFDSFALSIVKKYSYLLNVGSNVKIADSSTIHLEKVRIIDDIFNRLYEEEDSRFLKLISDFTDKKDNDIKDYILDINNKLDLKYDKQEYLDKYIEDYYSDKNIELLYNSYLGMLKRKIKEIDKAINLLSNYVDSDFLDKYLLCFENLFNSNTYEEIKASIDIGKTPTLRGADPEATSIKKDIKESKLKELENLTRFEDKKEIIDTLMSTKDYVSIIVDIIKELDTRLNEFKESLNIYEFNDISKMAIKVVKENKVVENELRDSFDEIMIDEYQDTSDLQDMFVSLIENNNVYVVGDIKQSIYRFRNANPYLFKSKYDSYSNNNGGFKIDLTRNFRSRSEVIDNINLIFSIIMTDDMGGADYVASHKMIPDNKDYLTIGKNSYDNNFELYNYQFDDTSKFSKEEIEIFFIAQDIKKKVDSKYQVYDKDLSALRDISYKDFAILLDKSTKFDLYKKIFKYFGIPVTKYNATNITEEIEIKLFKNILKLIINRRDKVYDVEFKYAFVSILRSYLFRADDQKIFDLVTEEKYDCEAMNIIDNICSNIESLSLNEIIHMIIDSFDFYNKLITVGDINNRINRITSIINIFDELASMGYTVDDAYNYLSELIDDEYKIEVKDLDLIQDSVKLMTIHASKGLEFPICYFASLHSQFNKEELKDMFMFNNKYGISSPYYKEGIGTTIIKDMIKDDYMMEDISEKIRLFYVALTRAREKFIIVTSLPDSSIYNIAKSRCFLDFINYIKGDISKYIKDLDVNTLNLTKDYNLHKKVDYKLKIGKSDKKLEFKEINIENTSLNKEKISKETHGLLDKDTKDKMKFGTMMHEILELLDFKNPDIDSLNIDNFYKNKIKDFLNLVDIDRVENIYKEYEFLYQKEDSILHGIVDLILEYPDKISIIDYKLKNVDDENYIKQLESYRDYIALKSNKKIDIYLFSIIDGTLNKLS